MLSKMLYGNVDKDESSMSNQNSLSESFYDLRYKKDPYQKVPKKENNNYQGKKINNNWRTNEKQNDHHQEEDENTENFNSFYNTQNTGNYKGKNFKENYGKKPNNNYKLEQSSSINFTITNTKLEDTMYYKENSFEENF